MKIGLVSLGCPKNLVDSEVMLGLAKRAGHTLTADPADAQVLIINTCAFIDQAKRESIDSIVELAGHKRTGHCRRLIVTGCLAERYRDELLREVPEIDALLGPGEVPGIVAAIRGGHGGPPPLGTRYPASGTQQSASHLAPRTQHVAPHPVPCTLHAAPARPSYLYDDRTPRVLSTPPHYAYVKVAEGCNYKCSFCIIPRLRGAYRSRSIGSVVREARSLAARGVRELLLVSQDTTYFGVDRGERGALSRLLYELNRVDGLRWIRLLYLYPTTVTTDTLLAMAECEKVCRYVDLPLQHASDAVLRRMRRPGTAATYRRLVDKIRRLVPDVTLRTTFIVGYPGETPADFDALGRFVDEVRFDHVGVFAYSHEEGTPAGRGIDDVPRREKERRVRSLMARQRRHVARANRHRIGQRLPLMVDGPSSEHPLVLRGRFEGQAPDIDPVVYLTDADPSRFRPGDMVEVAVVSAQGYDLVARPLLG